MWQYLATFIAIVKPKDKPNVEQRETVKPKIENLSEEDDEYKPIPTRMKNFFMSIPTNEDLRRYYFWEARKVGEREREIWATKKRTGRLTKLYQAQWFGKLDLKTPNTLASTEGDRHWEK